MSEDNAGVLVFPPLLFTICLVAGIVAHLLVGDHAPLPVWVRVAGGVLGAGAISIALWGQRVMTAAGTNIHPGQPTTAIVDAGPFAYSRNPLYLTLILLFAGIGVALASPVCLAFLLPLVVVLRWGVIAREERYLEAKFGDAYRGYKARVRRWV